MPKELNDTDNFNQAVQLYKSKIGSEPYQSLPALLNKIKNLWTSNITQSLAIHSLQPK